MAVAKRGAPRKDRVAGHHPGYGAMELRGAPRAGDITEAQAETILNTVLDAGIDYVDTSIERAERGTDRPLYRASGAEYYPASKCGCLVSTPTAPRGQRSAHVFTRDNLIAGVEQSLTRRKADYLDVVQFHQSPSRQTLAEQGALRGRGDPHGQRQPLRSRRLHLTISAVGCKRRIRSNRAGSR